MFNLLTRKKAIQLNIPIFFIGFLCLIFNILILILSYFKIFLFQNTSNLTNLLFIAFSNMFFIWILKIYNFFKKIYLRKFMFKEFIEIVNKTKMPKILPKVLYVYTTHNDFMPSRLLQNMRQTYENFEVWISDGSDKSEIRQTIMNFAKINKINLFQLDKSGSRNKAHNLNEFLSKSGVTFDYLMIGDADEIFDKNFVKKNIKLFYSYVGRNLAYVTPINQTYKSKGLWTSLTRCCDDVMYYKILDRNYSFGMSTNLFSASCLLSANFIKYMGNKFPDNSLEDVWAEDICVRSGSYYGILSPLSVCLQEFDKTFDASITRRMRIFDWSIALAKHNPFANFNYGYLKWFISIFILLFLPIFIMSSLVALSFLIWSVIVYRDLIYASCLFWPLIGMIVLFVFSNYLLNGWLVNKIIGKKRSFFSIFGTIHVITMIPYWLIHWFKATILSKYSDFTTTSSSSHSDINFLHSKKTKKNKFKICVFISFLFVIALALFNLMFAIYDLYTHYLWIAVFYNVFFGFFMLCMVLIIFQKILSCIKWNSKKYSPDKFIYYSNDFVSGKKIKERFYSKNNDLSRE